MAMTKRYAKILAEMLHPEQLVAFRAICGKTSMARFYVTPKIISDLVDMGLVRWDKTVADDPKEVVLLTPNGKKVAEFV